MEKALYLEVWSTFCEKLFRKLFRGFISFRQYFQPLSCWAQICPAFANSVDPDQLASEEANWSALFAIQDLNFYQQPGSSNLIGWKLDVGVAS